MSKFKLSLLLFLLLSCILIKAYASNEPANLPIFSYLDTDSLRLSEPISQVDKNLLQKVKILYVSPGCDPTMFDKSDVFQRLTIVNLHDKDNTMYLKGLAKNYSNIKILVVAQPNNPLSIEGMHYLSAFSKLEDLVLACKMQNSTELGQSIPKGLLSLSLANPEALKGTFTKLLRLDITDCFINADFFDQFNAPNLRRLDFCSVSISIETLKKLGQFKKLKYIYLDTYTFDESKILEVKRITSAKVLGYKCINLSKYDAYFTSH